MRKALFILPIAFSLMVSCSKDSMIPAPEKTKTNSFDIPITMERGGVVADEDATKSYLVADANQWTFNWEAGDQLGFFQYRDGIKRYQGTADIEKSAGETVISFANTDDFKSGDALFAYFMQKGVYNGEDATALQMSIPTAQVTTVEREAYYQETKYQFTLSRVAVSAPNPSKIDGKKSAVGVVAPSPKLTFKINGYSTDQLFAVSENASLTKLDSKGNGTATVTFAPITEDDKSNGKYSKTAVVDVYVSGHQAEAAKVQITASATVNEGLSIFGFWIITPSVSFSYSAKVLNTNGSATTIIEGLSEEKAIPVRDCMPSVSRQFNITKDIVAHPEDISSNMEMLMLGSLVEYRIFTEDASVAADENIQFVSFTSTNAPCAGTFTYNFGNELQISGLTDNTVYSALDPQTVTGMNVPVGQANYKSVYMVIAPGSYASTMMVVTDAHIYVFNLTERAYSRATRKVFNVNLASSNATVLPISALYPQD